MYSWSRRLGLIIAAVLAVGSGQALAQSPAPPVKASLQLDWKGGGQHAPFYLAKERGYYKDEGIDLDIISGSGSSDVVKQVGSKAVEFGIADALVIVQAAEQRVPLTAIAAYYQRTPIVVLSPQSKPVTDPAQLTQGVKLGSKKGSATFQGLTALLAANDIPLQKVTLVDIGFGVQPLLVKQVDAMMGFSMNEPIEAESAGMPVTVMAISDHGVDAYGLMIVSKSGADRQKSCARERFPQGHGARTERRREGPSGSRRGREQGGLRERSGARDQSP